MDACRYCGSRSITTVRCPAESKHYAWLLCRGCSRRIGFAPWPLRRLSREDFAQLATLALPESSPLPPLVGTPAQVSFAEVIRAGVLARIWKECGRDAARLARQITDAPCPPGSPHRGKVVCGGCGSPPGHAPTAGTGEGPCGSIYEPDNGEYVSPCHLPKGHLGPCEGYCLGSRALWSIEDD